MFDLRHRDRIRHARLALGLYNLVPRDHAGAELGRIARCAKQSELADVPYGFVRYAADPGDNWFFVSLALPPSWIFSKQVTACLETS